MEQTSTAFSEAWGRPFISPSDMNLGKEFYRAIPVDQLKSIIHSLELSRRRRQRLVDRGVATFMRIVRLSVPIPFPANEEK